MPDLSAHDRQGMLAAADRVAVDLIRRLERLAQRDVELRQEWEQSAAIARLLRGPLVRESVREGRAA